MSKIQFNKKEFSKKLLILDYVIALFIIAFLVYCGVKNYLYVSEIQDLMVESGNYNSIVYPYDLTSLTIILSVWIGQLGISSTAYYVMCKSDHKVQLPMQMINTMPKSIQNKIDMTEVITTLLNNSNN